MIASRIITGIMACDDIGSIGKENGLPDWGCPEDLVQFREKTLDSYLIMGRVTFDCLPERIFEKRRGIVLSRTRKEFHENVNFSPNIPSLVHLVEKIPADKKIFFIGGADTAEQLFANNIIDQFILSRINGTYDSDRCFSQKLLSELTSWPLESSIEKPGFMLNTYYNPRAFNLELVA